VRCCWVGRSPSAALLAKGRPSESGYPGGIKKRARKAYLLLRTNQTTATRITPPIHSGRSRAKLSSTHDMADRIVVAIPLKALEPAYSPRDCEISTPEYYMELCR